MRTFLTPEQVIGEANAAGIKHSDDIAGAVQLLATPDQLADLGDRLFFAVSRVFLPPATAPNLLSDARCRGDNHALAMALARDFAEKLRAGIRDGSAHKAEQTLSQFLWRYLAPRP